MNPRERLLAIGVLAVVALGGGAFLFKFLYYDPMVARRTTINFLKGEIKKKTDEIDYVRAERSKLERWRQLSLPADTKDADQLTTTRRLYNDYLTDLMRKSGFTNSSLKIASQKPDTRSAPTFANKKPIYTKLTFTVDEARGDLGKLVKMLEGFYQSGMLDQIKKLDVKKPRTPTQDQQPGDLNISLTIEALVVHDAEKRDFLLPLDRRMLSAKFGAMLAGPERGLPGLVSALHVASANSPIAPGNLAQPPRLYAAITSKNLFTGPSPVIEERNDDGELNKQIYFIGITRKGEEVVAELRDRYNNQEYSYEKKDDKSGIKAYEHVHLKSRTIHSEVDQEFDALPIPVRQIIRIDARDIYFRRNDKVYAIHLGHSLHEALQKSLKEDELKTLGLTEAAGEAASAKGQ